MDADDKMKVLIVEDDAGEARLIGEILHQFLLADVSVAPDLDSARRQMSSEDFDVVTLDYNLNDESGLSLLEDIAEGEDNPPVVVVSGFNQAHVAARSFELGAAGYVLKDFKLPEALADAVRDAFSRAALTRARRELDKEHALTNVAINELDEIFCTFDLKGRLTGWNRKLKEVSGLEDAQLHLLDAAELFQGGEELEADRIALSGGDRSSLHLTLRKGEQREAYDLTAVILRDAVGNRVGVCALGQKAPPVPASLPESLREQAEVADLTFDIILRTDMDGIVTFVNEEACRFWGRPASDLIGTKGLDLLRPDDLTRIQNGGTCALLDSGRRVSGFITHMKTPAGWRYVEWNAAPVMVDGIRAGTQVSGRDITEHELTERFLRHVNLELDAYAHTVSHDLRGPLSGIMLAADTLRLLLEDGSEQEKSEMIDEMARIISEYTEEAGSLVKNMLDLAERTQFPGEVEEIEVGEVVCKVRNNLAGDLEVKGVRLVEDGDLGRVKANGTQVYQVLLNLISNAVRHGASADEPIVSVSRLEDREECHRFLVRDNGQGIPEERLESIFKPFERGEESSGRGIGLATVDKIVKSYGGYVRAYNKDGACFEFGIRDFEGATSEFGI